MAGQMKIRKQQIWKAKKLGYIANLAYDNECRQWVNFVFLY